MARYREYTVALGVVYTAVVCADIIWEGENLATGMIDAEFKKHKEIEEPDFRFLSEHQGFADDEYEYKIQYSLIVRLESTSYERAKEDAVQFIDNLEMPDGITLDSYEEYDVTIARERAFLQRVAL